MVNSTPSKNGPLTGSPHDNPLWLEFLLFAGAIVLAYMLGWTAHDLVWSLWLSSLLVGYSIIVVQLIRRARFRYQREPKMLGAIRETLFTLIFFSLHFGLFHFVQGLILNQFFPLVERDDFPLAAMPLLLEAYWPFLIAAFVLSRPALVMPTGQVVHRKSFNPSISYRNVIRMHFLIFALAFTKSFALSPLLLYMLVYAVFFFPLERLFRKRRRQHLPDKTSS